MTEQKIKGILRKKEKVNSEFKLSQTALPSNTFESVCAFLNREGGHLILGADNNGNITGVDSSSISTIKNNLVASSNNPQKLDPPFLLFPQDFVITNRNIIYVYVPESSQVHKCDNTVYDRSEDGDFRVTEAHLIAEIYNRKRIHYTENKIYPHLTISDLDSELIFKSRTIIKNNKSSHPWLSLNDEEFLRTAGFFRTDYQTGEQGYTLAAALIFGTDGVIQNVLPHYKIDALARRENMDRYDDREEIRTNLINAYEKLMSFIAKHLPDKFYLEGTQRISLREKIFREVIANLIVHREYTNAMPATLTVFKNKVETLNANKPHGEGPINPNDFTPFPKNPMISKFFMQLGWVEEIGSGILNVNKYIKSYSGRGKPEFIEGDVFKTIIPIPVAKKVTKKESKKDKIRAAVNAAVKDIVSKDIKERMVRIVMIIARKGNVKTKDIVSELSVAERTIRRDLKIMANNKIIEFKGVPKTGGYMLTSKFKEKIK